MEQAIIGDKTLPVAAGGGYLYDFDFSDQASGIMSF
jgi:hypothetical protein